MFTALFYYKYEDPDLNETRIGDELFENENEAENYYFSFSNSIWNWNEAKKRYEFESINDDYEDEDCYAKKFHAYGIVVEIPNIDISD